MTTWYSFPVTLSVAILVAACSRSPRLDMKDPESFSKSAEAIREALSEEQIARLQEATAVVIADTVKPPPPLLKMKPEQWAAIRERLDGKTPSQIIALADEIRSRDAAAAAVPAGAN
ncbi:MAG: hypothetical protein RL698_3188 [Pseudomonadota bacterium]|jgi:hypothetical protein